MPTQVDTPMEIEGNPTEYHTYMKMYGKLMTTEIERNSFKHG